MPGNEREVTQELDLSVEFVFRVPRFLYGIAVDEFDGAPSYVTAHSNEDPANTAGAEHLRQNKIVSAGRLSQFWVINSNAQAGKKIVLRYLDRLEDVDVGVVPGQTTDSTGAIIDPATKDLQEDLNGLIGEVQASPTANTVLDRLKALLTGLSALVGEVQASPTANTVLDRLKTLGSVVQERAGTPTLYNVAIANADTEYSQALPAGTKKVALHLSDWTAFRIAWATGKVATPTEPYLTYPANGEYFLEGVNLAAATIYVAAPAGTKVAEIEVWV
jgi:hypothetical protein